MEQEIVVHVKSQKTEGVELALYLIGYIKSKDQKQIIPTLIEVQFKADRKDFYINDKKLDLKHGDIVAVEGEKSGHDIGKITMIGELVALQMVKKKETNQKSLRKDPIGLLLKRTSKSGKKLLKERTIYYKRLKK